VTRPPLDTVVHRLRSLVDAGAAGEATDAQLLHSFVGDRDEGAFATLLRRHGAMVLSVARRLVPRDDAEDVLQATFLLLARKAGSIRKREAVGSWLHGVASRLALKVRAQAARRRTHEQQAATMHKRESAGELTVSDLPQVLDEELGRLSVKYRTALVLCYLEGKTQDEAARQLGCPLGTVRSRLAQGRKLLRGRLVRRGLALSAEGLAVALLAHGADAAVPASLIEPTLRAAVAVAAGSAPPGLVSAPVAGLLRAGTSTATAGKVTVAVTLLVGVGLAAAGAGLLAHQPRVQQNAAAEPVNAPQPALAATTLGRPQGHVDRCGDPLPPGAVARLGTVRLRHGGQVFGVAFAADGPTLISHGGDAVLRFWDLATGQQRRLFPGAPPGISSFVLSRDGKLLATATLQKSDAILLWELPAGKQLRELRGRKLGSVLAFSADGKRLAAGGADARIHVWDVGTGGELFDLPGHQTSKFDWQNALDALAFSPDGKLLASAGKDGIGNGGRIRLWDTATGKQAFVLRCPDEPVTALVFARDGKALISGGDSGRRLGPDRPEGAGTIRLWDLAARKQVREFRGGGQESAVVALALSPNGKTLASGCMDKTVRLWDVGSGKPLRRLRGFRDHMVASYGLAFSPDGTKLASGGNGNVVYLWDVATGRRLLDDLPGQEETVRDVVVSRDGQTAAVGSFDGTVCLWDLTTGKALRLLRGHEGVIYSVPLSGDGKLVASGSSDGTVRLWELDTGRVRHTLRATGLDNGQACCVAFSTDSRLLVSGHMGSERLQDSALRLWAVATGKELRKLNGLAGQILAAAFSADGKVLSAATSEGRIRRWQVATGKEVASFAAGRRGNCEPVAFSADGRLVALHGENDNIELWDVVSGKQVHAFTTAQRISPCLAISPDGRFLACGYAGIWPAFYGREYDRTIRVWEIASGKEVVHFDVSSLNPVASVAFAPDDRSLITGMHDATVLVWSLVPPRARAGHDARSLEALWASLAGDDVSAAYAAVWALAASPEGAVPFLRRRLAPAAPADTARVSRLIADLDRAKFAIREAAFRELQRLGDEAGPLLRRALAAKPSPELRRRLEALLGTSGAIRSPQLLRQLRTVLVLERIATPPARRLLEELAHGVPEARLTQDARAALARLPAAEAAGR
jgi:RNA polymerase sigma factor (sigma-70 family)